MELEKIKDHLTAQGVKFYYEEESGVIINDDCLSVLPKIPEGCIDLVLTDPPYGTGGRDGAVHLSNNLITGNRLSIDSRIWLTRQYARFLQIAIKNDAHCYVFSDWRQFKDAQIAFETCGWELRSLLVWNKSNGMGEFWRSCHEFILWFTQRSPRRLTHGACFNVLSYPPVIDNKLHPVEKPIALVLFLMKASSVDNELVLDPFLGSGTTAVAAKQLGRRYIGIEIEEKYCAIAVDRLRQMEMEI